MNKYENEHNKTIERYAMLIKQLFGIALNEFAQVASIVEDDYSGNEMFNFDDYPQTMATVAKIVNTLANNMNVSVVNGCKAVWDISNMKNNALVESLFKGKDLTDEQKIRYFQNNEPALKAFTERKHNGLRLSDRVWNIVGGYKNDIETALSVSIEQGKSAHDLAKEVQQYLNEPDKLFRRVRDEFGELQLSKNAKSYHPGAGVYRSSYKNALRLARTEINMAYRTADFTRYQQFDFVVGIEIKTSGNHPEHDICDQLQGRYPKDFKFVGWHPNCRCYQTTILKTEEEMNRDEERMRKGQEPTATSENSVNDVPDNFKEWVEDNEEKIKRAKNKPYFVKDNQKYINASNEQLSQQGKAEIMRKAVVRHAARTAEQVKDIQDRWAKHDMKRIIDSMPSDKQKLAHSLATELDTIVGKGDIQQYNILKENLKVYEKSKNIYDSVMDTRKVIKELLNHISISDKDKKEIEYLCDKGTAYRLLTDTEVMLKKQLSSSKNAVEKLLLQNVYSGKLSEAQKLLLGINGDFSSIHEQFIQLDKYVKMDVPKPSKVNYVAEGKIRALLPPSIKLGFEGLSDDGIMIDIMRSPIVDNLNFAPKLADTIKFYGTNRSQVDIIEHILADYISKHDIFINNNFKTEQEKYDFAKKIISKKDLRGVRGNQIDAFSKLLYTQYTGGDYVFSSGRKYKFRSVRNSRHPDYCNSVAFSDNLAIRFWDGKGEWIYVDGTAGIAYNTKYQYYKYKEMQDNNQLSGWWSKDGLQQTFNHELGHKIDELLSLSQDKDFAIILQKYDIYGNDKNNQAKQISETKKLLSEYAAYYFRDKDNTYNYTAAIGEIIAEAWAEYMGNPTPRPFAKEVGELIKRRLKN